MKVAVLVSGLLVTAGAVGLIARSQNRPAQPPLPTGKSILVDLGPSAEVGNWPVNIIASPDGKWIVTTNVGANEQISVIDAKTGKLVSKQSFNVATPKREALYFGLHFGTDGRLYASRGGQDMISVFAIAADGTLRKEADFTDAAPEGAKLPNIVAGLSSVNNTLVAVENQTNAQNGLRGHLRVFDIRTGEAKGRIDCGGYPLGVAALQLKSGREVAYVANERDSNVTVVNLADSTTKTIKVGKQPSHVLAAGGRVYVANSGGDSISVIDPESERVVQTLLVRPPAFRGLPSCTPLGMSVKGDRLLVACADLNAVVEVNLKNSSVVGYRATGWYPTAVAHSSETLFVANAKGVKSRNPNPKSVRGLGTYILNILEGAVTMMPVQLDAKRINEASDEVLRLNRADKIASTRQWKNPGIKHVIYIIKENRTYDNVLGDLPQGNGDPSICLFPREITPNQHALVERFALMDNFFVCAEVSGDGWNWSTAGMVSAYNSRNVVHNYSGRGRDYDFEGENTGVRPIDKDLDDVNEPPGGYIWDAVRKKGLTMRNYGFFVGEIEALGTKRPNGEGKSDPTKKALRGVTDEDFREYDLDYADSDAYVQHGETAPKQIKAWGNFRSPSRFSEFKREFDAYVKNKNLPQFIMLRFPRDHTSGTSVGRHSPRAMIADNDYAVGQVVEAVSKSPYWKETAIFVVEDDAQAGIDHVDCHRSTAYVISPFVPKGTVTSAFYNTDSVLKTIELILGLPPMNGYDAIAEPFRFFSDKPANDAPFTALLPPKEIVCEVNKKGAFMQAFSEKHLRTTAEDSAPDEELNKLLWHLYAPKSASK